MGSAIKQGLKGLGATLALLALVGGFPLGLAVFVGWPLPAGLPSFSEITEAARSGIDDMVIVKTLAVLGWVAWGQLTLAVAVEAVALARGRTARTMPVFPGLQVTAAHLLAGVALLLGVFSAPRDQAVPLRALATASRSVPVTATTVADPASAEPQPQLAVPNERPAGPAPTYAVQRNDSWWEIAESQLGDGLRWQELRRLNIGRTMPDGRTIDASTETIYQGWVLELPGDHVANGDAVATVGQATEVVVERGDNLWDIAEEHLEQLHQRPVTDDEVRPYWQDVVGANRERLVDGDNPNLIFTGQVIHLPGAEADTAAAPLPPTSEPAPSTEPPPPDGGDGALPAAPDADHQAEVLDGDAPTATTSSAVTDVAEPDDDLDVETSDYASDAATVTGVLGTAGALLAVGISASMWRRRRRREQSLPRGTAPPPPPPELDDLRAEVVRRGDVDHVDALRQALAEAAAELARRRSGARVRLVQANDDRIELLLSEPVLPAPSGWRPEASGTAWVHDEVAFAAGPSGNATHPALTSLGRLNSSGQLYVDLESEGMLCLLGEEAPARDLARSIVLELATSPTADGVTVVVVGDLDVGDTHDRIRHAETWDEIADDALAWAQQTRSLLAANRWPSPQAGRALGDRPDDLAPLVIVLTHEPDDERFGALCSTIGETVLPVVVVLVGQKLDGATTVEVDADELRIPTLALSCAPQGISSEAAEDIDRLLTSADGPPGQLSLISDSLEDREDEPPQSHDGPYVDPPFDILVRVLGEIEVVGGHQPLSPKQTAVVTFIALHSPTTADRVEDAVWSAPTASRRKRLANTISDARPSLGADHLPAAYDGRYRVGSRVRTDLELFDRRLAYARSQEPEAAIETLRGALDLVTDRVFTYRNADRASYAWVDTENWISTTELKVTDTAEELAERYLDVDDVDGAIWAAKRGLVASPTHTRLTHVLMRAYFAAGDAKAAERVYESYVSALEQLQLDEVDPELAEAYEQIRRGTPAAG